jgi:hypothetical protein
VPCCYERNTNIQLHLKPSGSFVLDAQRSTPLFPNELFQTNSSGQTLGDRRLGTDVWEQIFPSEFFRTSFTGRIALLYLEWHTPFG